MFVINGKKLGFLDKLGEVNEIDITGININYNQIYNKFYELEGDYLKLIQLDGIYSEFFKLFYNDLDNINPISITFDITNCKVNVDVLMIYIPNIENFNEILNYKINTKNYKYITIFYCNKIFICNEKTFCKCLLQRLRDNFHVYNESKLSFFESEYISKSIVRSVLEQYDYSKIKDGKIVEFCIFDKSIETSHDLICYSNCNKFSYKNDDESIKYKYIVNQDARCIEVKDFIKNSEKYIGLFKPIVNLYKEEDIRFEGLHYYLSNIGGESFEVLNISNAGKGVNEEFSKASAIGESFERYCSQYKVQSIKETVYESYNKLNNVISDEFLKDNTEKFDEHSFYYWTLCENLVTKEKLYIPSECVYFEFLKTKDFLNTTTGLSAGSNLEEAIYQATLEIIERDSYIRAFRTKKPQKRIIMDKFYNNKNKELISSILNDGFEIHAQFLESDLNYVYIIHVTIEDKIKYPHYTHGIGASFSLETAYMRAVTEAFQLRITQKIVKELSPEQIKQRKLEPYLTWGNGEKECIEPYLNEYCEGVILSSSIEKVEKIDLVSFNNKIHRDLYKLGYNSYFFNLSTSDVPVKVVRVIIEGYQNYDLNGKFQSERLKKEMKNNIDEREVFY